MAQLSYEHLRLMKLFYRNCAFGERRFGLTYKDNVKWACELEALGFVTLMRRRIGVSASLTEKGVAALMLLNGPSP